MNEPRGVGYLSVMILAGAAIEEGHPVWAVLGVLALALLLWGTWLHREDAQ